MPAASSQSLRLTLGAEGSEAIISSTACEEKHMQTGDGGALEGQWTKDNRVQGSRVSHLRKAPPLHKANPTERDLSEPPRIS